MTTEGEYVPSSVQVTYNNETYFLNQTKSNEFTYTFYQPRFDIEFQVAANGVSSDTYKLNVLEAPTLLSFEMFIDYPEHTQIKDQVYKNNGSANVPEGSTIFWKVLTKATTNVNLISEDSVSPFNKDKDLFELKRQLRHPLKYMITMSNKNLKNHESLAFSIEVVRDEFPEIIVETRQDSSGYGPVYFYGRVSDDYGLSKLEIIYYPINDPGAEIKVPLVLAKSNYDEFINVFPANLDLLDGVGYEVYFRVTDNDKINNYKSKNSQVFSYKQLSKDEKEDLQLNQQLESIEVLNMSLKKLKKQDEMLKEFSKLQNEKTDLNFNDKRKLENYIQRQKEQEVIMQRFNKKLRDNLTEFQKNNKKDPFKEAIEERLSDNQRQLEKDEELLDELDRLAKQIQKEELADKLEKLAKQNKNKKRSLEQLLELTKRYYVSKKAEKLRVQINEIAKDQEKLANQAFTPKEINEQKELVQRFTNAQREFDELNKENQNLRQPIKDIRQDRQSEDTVKREQQQALENLEKQKQPSSKQQSEGYDKKANKSQNNAAKMLKQMSESMSQMMSSGGSEQLSEDIDMLRQILDNLLLFSFDQEKLMHRFKTIQINNNKYASYLKSQQGLKEHFEHVDDSLFALSLRQPMISEKINKEITDVFFNIDKSLNQLAENRLYQGVGAQQYTINSTNVLGNFLSDLLDNMQNQMNLSPGQGSGSEMQLPDIIMSQESLNKQMQEGLKSSEQGKDSKDKDGQNQKQGGNAQGDMEFNNGELYNIYQRQQRLREALNNLLDKQGDKKRGNNLLREMEQIETDLLNQGFTNETLNRMIQLQQQLLKLENATLEQSMDDQRKSLTNQKQFSSSTKELELRVKQYFNTTEILNRQALPLRQEYKKKVQEYFKRDYD